MSVTRYQALTQDFRLPPLAPAFREGWQSDRAAVRAPARNAGRDADLFAVAAPAAAPNGWDAERSVVRAAARALARDEQSSMTLLSTPPLAPAFREGWQSDRFRPQPVARAVAKDEPSSGTLLSAPPLAPAFKEGWAAERRVVRAARSPVAAYALDFRPAPPAPLSFPEGWQSERAVLPRALRSPVDAATVFLFPGVLATFREGWQSDRATLALPRVRARADSDVLFAALVAPFLAEDARALFGRRDSRRPADDGLASRTFVAPAAPEGWAADRAAVPRPRRPFRRDPDVLFVAAPAPPGTSAAYYYRHYVLSRRG